MSIECKKCGYKRQQNDTAPDYECPNCGIIYHKTKVSPGKQKPDIKKKGDIYYKKANNVFSIATIAVILVIGIFLGYRYFNNSKESDPLTTKHTSLGEPSFDYDIRGDYKGSAYDEASGLNWHVEFTIGNDYRITKIEWTSLLTHYYEHIMSWAYPDSVSMKSSSSHNRCSVSVKDQSLMVLINSERGGPFANFQLEYDYGENPYDNNLTKPNGLFEIDNAQGDISCTITAMIPNLSKSDQLSKENVIVEFNPKGMGNISGKSKNVVRVDKASYWTNGSILGDEFEIISLDQAVKDRRIEISGVGDFIGIVPLTIYPCNGLLLDMNQLLVTKERDTKKLELCETNNTHYYFSYRERNRAMQSKIKIVFTKNGDQYALNLNRKIKKSIDPVTKKETAEYLRYDLEKID